MFYTLFLLFIFYIPFQLALNPREGVDLASVRIFIPLLFLIWLLIGLKNRKIIIPHSPQTFLIFTFLFLNAFSLFFAENINWGIRKLLFLLSIFPLYFVVSSLPFSKNKQLNAKLMSVIACSSSLLALVGIIQFVLQFIVGLDKTYAFWVKIITPFLGNSFSQAVLQNPSWLVNVGGHTLLRATAFFPDPHMLAFYLGMTAPIVLGLYLQQKKNKTIYLASLCIILLADVLTFSRGGYLGLLAGLTFFGIIYLKTEIFIAKKNPSKIIFSALTLATIIFLLVVVPNPLSQRLTSILNFNEGSNIGRIQTWQQSIKIIKKNSLTGVGLGNYASTIKPSADYREPIYSHNLYFDIAVETGILNAISFILIVLFSIKSFLKKYRQKNNLIYLSLASGLVVFSIHSIFETALFSVHILPLLIIFISLSNNNHSTLPNQIKI